jgi:hypothetical protein
MSYVSDRNAVARSIDLLERHVNTHTFSKAQSTCQL